ncbi:MAG: arginine--tRNA ligase [Gammaproteobacteria bacterium]
MQTLISDIQFIFKNAVHQCYPTAQLEEMVEITPATQPQFGHYQCNSAMRFAKPLKKTPRDVANDIVNVIQEMRSDSIEKLDIAGPGFINIWLKPDFLAARLNQMSKDPKLGVPMVGQGHKMIIDFSSPNIAKEMHVGHLRSTIIGDAIARLFEFFEYDVLRLNHLGDWGTQFGMLITYLKRYHPLVVNGTEPCELSNLVEWYKASKKEFDENPEFKKQSQLEVVALQSGEPETRAAWQKICDISQKAYSDIYELLNVSIIPRGESFYNDMLPHVVKELEEKGLITVSDGAKCVYLEGYENRQGEPLPLIVQKADGGYNYASTDMAAVKHRAHVESGDRLIYVTDAGQAQHFAMVFKSAEKASYYDPSKVRIDHVPFGLVLGPDGKKFKTRSGDTEKLVDLLSEAVKRAEKILDQKELERNQPFEGDKQAVAKSIGIGAVKYADLSCNRTHDYTFSYDRMLSFEGNTAAFLLYAYVRIAGIQRKSKIDLSTIQAKSEFHIQHPAEIALAVHLAQFSEILLAISNDLLPSRLCDYLYQLSEKFNAFFRDCRVVGSEEEISRLKLCYLTSMVLKTGLDLLGLQVVERM